MPQVPRYGEPRTTISPLPNVATPSPAPIEAFGGGQAASNVGRAAQNIGTAALDIYAQEKQIADDAFSFNANSRLTEKKNDLLWNPKTGAYTRKGSGSFGVVEEYETEFNKAASDVENEANNEVQRQMVQRIKESNRVELRGNLERHVFQESQKFYDDSVENGIIQTRNDGVLNFQTPGKIQESIDLQRAAIVSHAANRGLPPEFVSVAVKDATSKTHVGVIRQMLISKNDIGAQEYYEKEKGSFTPEDHSRIESEVREGFIRGDARRRSDEILAGAKDRGEALEAVRDIKNTDVQAETRRRVNEYYEDQARVKRETEEKIFQQASNVIEQTQDRTSIPESVWLSLSVSERNALDARARQLREGVQPVTDWEEYYNLKSIASIPATRDKFLKTNLLIHRPKMADPEFKELVSLQASLRAGDESAEKQLDGYRTDAQIVNDELASAGIDPTPKPGKPQSKQVALFRSMVDKEIATMQSRTGKKATNADVQQIVDNLLIKGSVRGGLFNLFFPIKKFIFEAEPGEVLAIDVKEIPRAERLKIEDALHRKGIPATDTVVIELYKRKINSAN